MQEPRLTTAETMRTPLSLVVAFPKHAEDSRRSKVLRCGYKPPEVTALTGKELPSALKALFRTVTEQAAFPYTPPNCQRACHFPLGKHSLQLASAQTAVVALHIAACYRG